MNQGASNPFQPGHSATVQQPQRIAFPMPQPVQVITSPTTNVGTSLQQRYNDVFILGVSNLDKTTNSKVTYFYCIRLQDLRLMLFNILYNKCKICLETK